MAGSEDAAEYGVPLKVTLKAGAGFEAPWLTVEADSVEELSALLASLELTDVLDRVVQSSRSFRSKFTAGAPALATKAAPSSSTAKKQDSPSSPAASAPAVSTTQNVTVEGSDDPIAAELKAATNMQQLRAVFPKWKNNGWTDDHVKLATARKAELDK